MKWPWTRKDRTESVSAEEAKQVRAKAEGALKKAQGERAEVRSIAAKLREQRAENHFSELILGALKEGR